MKTATLDTIPGPTYYLCAGLPPKFSGTQDPCKVTGAPRRVDGGMVVKVVGYLWDQSLLTWEEPCCNVYNADGTRPFGC